MWSDDEVSMLYKFGYELISFIKRICGVVTKSVYCIHLVMSLYEIIMNFLFRSHIVE